MYKHKAGVYVIHQIGTDNYYIGSSSDIPVRWLRHKHELSKGKHHSGSLQKAWTELGANAFEFSILEECERDRTILAAREQEYLNTFHPVFNSLQWASLSSLGSHSPRPGITHCPQGHPYDEANTGHTKRNQRYCRKCAAEKSIAKYQHTTPFRLDGPVCQQGHEWTPENTITLATGTRQCRACKQQRIDARNERNRQRYETDAEFRERSRLDYERHKEERLAKQSERGFVVRQKNRAERIARGEKPGTLPACRKAGHPWTPETTVYKGTTRLCKICRDATRAAESPEAHAARLARRRELERDSYHDANQRAYARRKERLTASVR